jgi:23S rRNA pseudouridine1911/1915/1917 synthase
LTTNLAQASAPSAPLALESFRFTLTKDDAGQRLDKVLARHLPAFSRGRLQALIMDGVVRLDDQAMLDCSRKVRGNEAVSLILPPPVPAGPVAQSLPLEIVFEDAHLLVVNKAAGMVVHPSNGHESGTLVHALLGHCAGRLSGINGVLRPGIVHRLDKETSGLLVVAKSDRAHHKLAAQFADHGRTGPLERRYLALVWGQLPRKFGTIDAAITRSTQNRERMIVSKAVRARFAITHYEVLEEFANETGIMASLIACRLETGRTHQIRVHLSHIGHPLLGDPLYGAGFRTRHKTLPEAAAAALTALNRQALHAETLAFAHPVSGEIMAFEAPPPPGLARLIGAFEDACSTKG